MMSIDPHRTREIEGVGTVELVCVGRLLRMSHESLIDSSQLNPRGASCQPASMGSFLTISQTCLSCLHLVYGCGCSSGLGSENKQTLKLGTQA